MSKKAKKNKKQGKKNGKKKSSKSNYTVETLKEAIKAIKEENLSFSAAADKYNIPKTTLHSKLHGKSNLNSKKGPDTYLTKDEENEVVNWILECSYRGFPITKRRLLQTVKNLVKALAKNNKKRKFPVSKQDPGRLWCPGNKWYGCFMERHPQLSIRMAQNLTCIRAKVSKEKIQDWFAHVQNHLEKEGLLNIEPDRVFNLDESAFKLVPAVEKVIAKKGARAVYQVVSASDKSTVTVLFNGSASGQLAPPLILFELKTTPRLSVVNKVPKGWGIGHTESGWMTGESFFSYVKNVFHPWLLEEKIQFPVLLYVDNHSSHVNIDLLRFCLEKDIELIALYPNSTHLIQPLDVGFFRPLKEQYKQSVNEYKEENKIVDLKKNMVAPALQHAIEAMDIKKALISGFKASGLYPLNVNEVQLDILNKKKKQNKKITDSNEIVVNENDNQVSKVLEEVELFLSEEQLESFKKNENAEWQGLPENKKLYQFWKHLKNKINSITDPDPTPSPTIIEKNQSTELDSINNHNFQFSELQIIQDSKSSTLTAQSEIFNSIVEEDLTQKTLESIQKSDVIELIDSFGNLQSVQIVNVNNNTNEIDESSQIDISSSFIEKSLIDETLFFCDETFSTDGQVIEGSVDENNTLFEEENKNVLVESGTENSYFVKEKNNSENDINFFKESNKSDGNNNKENYSVQGVKTTINENAKNIKIKSNIAVEHKFVLKKKRYADVGEQLNEKTSKKIKVVDDNDKENISNNDEFVLDLSKNSFNLSVAMDYNNKVLDDVSALQNVDSADSVHDQNTLKSILKLPEKNENGNKKPYKLEGRSAFFRDDLLKELEKKEAEKVVKKEEEENDRKRKKKISDLKDKEAEVNKSLRNLKNILTKKRKDLKNLKDTKKSAQDKNELAQLDEKIKKVNEEIFSMDQELKIKEIDSMKAILLIKEQLVNLNK